MRKARPKKILFVEDRPSTIVAYRRYLEKADPAIEINHVLIMEEAYNLIVRERKQFDLILIDLNNPPVPKILEKPYGERLMRLDLNEGQVLGMWLSDQYKDTAYAYLTAMPIVWDDEVGFSQEKITVLDKNSLLPKDFYRMICEIYQGW